jgi:hypothetical protein
MAIAKNSFEAGCLIQGEVDCSNQYPKDDDLSTMYKSGCLETIITQCESRAIKFGRWMSSGKAR